MPPIMRRRSPALQVARHGPALAGFPEAVDAGGDDGFAIDRDPERFGRAVHVRGQDGLERKAAGRCVLRQDAVADGDRFDLSRAAQGLDQGAGGEAGSGAESTNDIGESWACSRNTGRS